MAEGELLGDHPAHRDAHDVGRLELERVHQAGSVVGQLGDGERCLHAAAATNPPVVVGDHVEVALQLRGERLAPMQVTAAHPHDQQQGLVAAAADVEQLEVG